MMIMILKDWVINQIFFSRIRLRGLIRYFL